MRPAVGRYSPVSTLMKVLLPEPFGPISACTVPRRTAMSTPSSAFRPPKCLARPSMRSTASAAAPAVCDSSGSGGTAPSTPRSRRTKRAARPHSPSGRNTMIRITAPPYTAR